MLKQALPLALEGVMAAPRTLFVHSLRIVGGVYSEGVGFGLAKAGEYFQQDAVRHMLRISWAASSSNAAHTSDNLPDKAMR